MGLLDSYTGTLSSSDGQMTPAAQGLLAAGLGILAHNRGLTSGTQAVGMGGLEGLNAYAGAKQAQMQQQLQNAQLQQLGFGLQKNKMLLDMAQQYLGNGPQMATTPNPAADIGGAADGSAGAGSQDAPVQVASAAPSLGGAQTPLSGGAPVQSAPQGMATQGGPFGNMPRPLVAYGLLNDPTALFTSAAKQFEPTDIQKQMTAAGIDTNSPIGRQILQQAIFKANYVPNEAYRGGGYVHNPQTGAMEQLPQVPEGYTAQKNAAGQWTVVPVQGGAGAIAATAAAQEGGKGSVLPYAGVDAQGNPLPVTNRTAAATGRVGNQPPPIPSIPGLGGSTGMQNSSDVPLPGGGAAIYAAAPMGAAKGAETGAGNQQDMLSKSWSGLIEQNRQAATTNSYLQSIKALSSKAATGQQSDRINYANGLLSLAGSEKATDAVTANNLLDKYSNQIVARLGQGGLGTDAARSILQSAYPNAHMTPDAINEAADNLIGANQMTQAKAKLLAPLANALDAKGYTNAEMKFDQNADPRIFQYMGITDPAKRQAFAKKLMQQDPKIVDKIKALQDMGAF
jgi:hypothetical protein